MPLLVRLLFVWFFNMCVSGVNENVLHNVVYPLLYLGLDYPNMHPNLFRSFPKVIYIRHQIISLFPFIKERIQSRFKMSSNVDSLLHRLHDCQQKHQDRSNEKFFRRSTLLSNHIL